MPARRAFEHFPIQSRGHGSDGLRRGAISRPRKLNHRVRDFAQLLLLNNLRGLFKVRTGPLLCAELHDAIRCLVRTQRVDRPLHSVRQRLFDVDVLTCRNRVGEYLAMPMIRRRNVHGVDVRTIEHTSIVFIGVELGVQLTGGQLLYALIEACLVHVAHHGILDVLQVLQEQVGHLPAAIARSDQRDAHAIARASTALRARCGGVEQTDGGGPAGKIKK